MLKVTIYYIIAHCQIKTLNQTPSHCTVDGGYVPVKRLCEDDGSSLVVYSEQSQAVLAAGRVKAVRHLAVLVRVPGLQCDQHTVHWRALRHIHRILRLREHRPVLVDVYYAHVQLITNDYINILFTYMQLKCQGLWQNSGALELAILLGLCEKLTLVGGEGRLTCFTNYLWNFYNSGIFTFKIKIQ